ncbi:radical SAM protein [uncultured Traorella sp.]|uniref:radical SAM/SPASM domain-containing protein n=1 Tax=uncultured Traorella sp. TaxID=1929048 RepID=UPI0025D86254|nr:radical SAM protein [uncultured Traorella sp.]
MRFKKVYIEITNQCNLNCSFCSHTNRPSKMMTVHEFENIILQIKPYTWYIYLHVLGEPLMHPDLSMFLQIAHDNDLYVNLTTNATLLKQQSKILLDSPALRQINLSLHSFPHIPDYLENAVMVGDELSEHGVYVSYRLWTMKDKIDENTKKTIAYLEDHYHADIHEYRNSVKLKPHCFLSFDREFLWPSLSHAFIKEKGTCQGWRHMCAILVDGSVVPCCLDANAHALLGNIFTTPFEDILREHESLLHNFQNHVLSLPLCQRCHYRTRFDHKKNT